MRIESCQADSVDGLTRGLVGELGAHRIRVNVLTPGWGMMERQITLWLAATALFLASDQSRAHGAGIRRR